VLLLNHDYAGHPFQVDLSKALANSKLNILHAFAGNLVTPRGDLSSTNRPTNLTFHEIPMDAHYRSNKYSFHRRFLMERLYGKELVNLIRREKPDCILSANTPSEPQWMLTQSARRLHIPLITWVQDIYSHAVSRLAKKFFPLLGNLIGSYYRFLDSQCLRNSTAVIAISEDFHAPLAQLGANPKRFFTIPNWAPLEELPVGLKLNPWSKAHGLENKFVFLYSGTLAMKHNPDLIRSLAYKFKDDDTTRFVLISEGPGADYLSKAKQREDLKNLIILPYQPFSNMPDVLASADVLLAVLERDAGIFSVPSKVMSYHCAARPILAAIPFANQAARYLQANGSGLCVEPEDLDGWLAAAKSLHASADLRNRLGASARSFAEKNFAIRPIAARFEEVFQFALNNPLPN